MDIPTIDHPTDKVNDANVTVGGITYYFSYHTLIAFDAWDGSGPVVRVNAWGPTTGRHLNAIDEGDKDARLDAAAFAEAVAMITADSEDEGEG